ncbi:MAG: Cysteine desulfurase [uncultured Nocardioidaceae bacterium]|uniref:Cysteine desulfurase n=1 Tax=uncultured Nocardioidaceae bacterium TaxID=253824 RepID=A0A6J4LN66_9ACTN|nr:MAG: Cysteine desulfurase [uncultured Nocardioidaceae bacterium]
MNVVVDYVGNGVPGSATPGDQPQSGPGRNVGYFDSASAEPLHPAARDSLLAALDSGFADPLGLHRPGRNARLLLDNAREVVAACLNARPDEVVFATSGAAAVHAGVLGLLAGRARISTRLVHSAVEHSSVIQAGAWFARSFAGSTDVVPVDAWGRVSPDAVAAALQSPAGLLAVQSANGEVGTIQPIPSVLEVSGEVPLFVDFAATAGRLELPPGWSAAAAGAHQWGGPAGVGVLLVRKGSRWRPPFPADDRADPRTSGFENVPAILAAAAGLQAAVAEREERNARQRRLVERIRDRVAATVPDVEVFGDPVDRLPHLLSFSCLYVDGEALVGELDRLGFAVASGSACTASTVTPSHVLEAMGALTHGNVRVSLTRDTTVEEVDRFLDVLPGTVARLRERAGVR